MYKKLDRIIFRCVFCDGYREIFSVNRLLQFVDMRAYVFTLISKVDLCGGAVTVQAVKFLQTVRCKEIAEQSTEVQNAENYHRQTCQLMLFQLSAHEGPLGCQIIVFLRLYFFLEKAHYLPPPE